MEEAAYDQPGQPGASAVPLREVHQAVATSVGVVRWRCQQVAAGNGATQEQIDAIAIAVSEAATNVVLYAYPTGEPGVLDLELSAPAPQILQITVTDAGVGLGNAESPGGLGQGLLLMERLADSLRVTRPAGGGTAVRMRFRLG